MHHTGTLYRKILRNSSLLEWFSYHILQWHVLDKLKISVYLGVYHCMYHTLHCWSVKTVACRMWLGILPEQGTKYVPLTIYATTWHCCVIDVWRCEYQTHGGYSITFMCCHPQASNYRSTHKQGYFEYESMTPYHRYSFTDLLQLPS